MATTLLNGAQEPTQQEPKEAVEKDEGEARKTGEKGQSPGEARAQFGDSKGALPKPSQPPEPELTPSGDEAKSSNDAAQGDKDSAKPKSSSDGIPPTEPRPPALNRSPGLDQARFGGTPPEPQDSPGLDVARFGSKAQGTEGDKRRREELTELRHLVGDVDPGKLNNRQVAELLHFARETKTRTDKGDARLAAIEANDLESFAKDYPTISVDGHRVDTRELFKRNTALSAPFNDGSGMGRIHGRNLRPEQLAAELQDLARDGRISVGPKTDLIAVEARRPDSASSINVYNSTGKLVRLSSTSGLRTRNEYTTQDGFTGTAREILDRANNQVYGRSCRR